MGNLRIRPSLGTDRCVTLNKFVPCLSPVSSLGRHAGHFPAENCARRPFMSLSAGAAIGPWQGSEPVCQVMVRGLGQAHLATSAR